MNVSRRFYALRLAAAFLIFTLLSTLASCASPRIHTAQTYAMGTLCTVTEELAPREDGDASTRLFSLLFETESLISHKIEGSDIYLLNQNGSVTVRDARLSSALRLAEEVKAKTDGRFSVSVLPLTSLWDFSAKTPAPPSREALSAALAETENSALTFDGDTVHKTGGDIDLGALGKGYACDVLADALRQSGRVGLVSVGGSIAAVGEKSSGAWRVGVRDPFSASRGETLGTLALTDAFVSTSGDYEKRFVCEGVTYHHILDPRTGMPAESDLTSVTVVAASGTLSDILSTACFLVGSERAFALAEEYGASLVAVGQDGTLLVSTSLADIFTPKAGWEVVYR